MHAREYDKYFRSALNNSLVYFTSPLVVAKGKSLLSPFLAPGPRQAHWLSVQEPRILQVAQDLPGKDQLWLSFSLPLAKPNKNLLGTQYWKETEVMGSGTGGRR